MKKEIKSLQCYQKADWAAYHDGRLDERVRFEMEEHLLICDLCMQSYLETVESSLQDEKIQLSEDFTDDLMAMIEQERISDRTISIKVKHNHQDRKKQKLQFFAYYCAAASIALFFWVGGYFEGLSDNISKGIDLVDKVQEPKITFHDRSFIQEGWTKKVFEQEHATFIENLIPKKE